MKNKYVILVLSLIGLILVSGLLLFLTNKNRTTNEFVVNDSISNSSIYSSNSSNSFQNTINSESVTSAEKNSSVIFNNSNSYGEKVEIDLKNYAKLNPTGKIEIGESALTDK